MRPDWISDDDLLLAEIGAATRATGVVPDAVVAAAKAAFELRTLDEELAMLTYDSVTDSELAGAVRSERLAVRSLVFGFGDVSLDVDILPDSLVGQLHPPMAGAIVLESPTRPPLRGEIDELGMFSVPLVGPGDVRFRVEPREDAERSGFVTQWTRI